MTSPYLVHAAARLDHPVVRAHHECPLCGGSKRPGLVACWPCWNEWDLKHGNDEAEVLLDEAERVWSAEQVAS